MSLFGHDYQARIWLKRHWLHLAGGLVRSRLSWIRLVVILALTFIGVACGQEERFSLPSPEEQTPVLVEPTAMSSPTSKPEPTTPPLPLSTLTGSDGGTIAFYSERDGNAEIYVINADGTNERRLTNNRSIDETPAWWLSNILSVKV